MSSNDESVSNVEGRELCSLVEAALPQPPDIARPASNPHVANVAGRRATKPCNGTRVTAVTPSPPSLPSAPPSSPPSSLSPLVPSPPLPHVLGTRCTAHAAGWHRVRVSGGAASSIPLPCSVPLQPDTMSTTHDVTHGNCVKPFTATTAYGTPYKTSRQAYCTHLTASSLVACSFACAAPLPTLADDAESPTSPSWSPSALPS